MENQKFLSFVDYLESQKIKYNKDEFNVDLHYRLVIFNRYNVKYHWYCQKHKLMDDRDKYQYEKYQYERRLRDYREK